MLKNIEKDLYKAGARAVCGIDEAGRGPLAGPVVAAAVILLYKKNRRPKLPKLPGIADSKKLTPQSREQLFKIIARNSLYGIGIISNKKIDQLGIVKAVGRAMQEAVKALPAQPDCLLIDGIDNFQFSARSLRNMPKTFIPTAFIEKGDNRIKSIMAASIIAKVTRDGIMLDYDKKYPEYEFRKHKGYGTKAHYKALRRHGPCELHRLTFCAANSNRRFNRNSSAPRK